MILYCGLVCCSLMVRSLIRITQMMFARQSQACPCRRRNCTRMLTDTPEELPQNFQELLAKNWMEIEMQKMQLFHLKMISWVVWNRFIVHCLFFCSLDSVVNYAAMCFIRILLCWQLLFVSVCCKLTWGGTGRQWKKLCLCVYWVQLKHRVSLVTFPRVWSLFTQCRLVVPAVCALRGFYRHTQ